MKFEKERVDVWFRSKLNNDLTGKKRFDDLEEANEYADKKGYYIYYHIIIDVWC
jgi:hypothetical protein